jgi:hypothetical protein
VRNLEEAVAIWLPWEMLASIVELAAKLRRREETDLLQQVGEAIGAPGRRTLDELRETHSEENVRKAVATAMLSKNNPWFKTSEGGQALGDRLLEIGLPQEMQEALKSFWMRVLAEAGWVS